LYLVILYDSFTYAYKIQKLVDKFKAKEFLPLSTHKGHKKNS
jgi:hypothetical protein